jgi:hypothetical protein
MDSYKGWNIKDMAEEVMQAKQENDDTPDSTIYDLDDYLHDIVYISVYSKDPNRASLITELVREYIEELVLNELNPSLED